MRVHLIKKRTLEDYVRSNAQARDSIENWYSLIKYADWNKPSDIMNTFNTADILGRGSERIVFNIGGNKYRLICKYKFGNKNVHLFVKWIGTHNEYTQLCNSGFQYMI